LVLELRKEEYEGYHYTGSDIVSPDIEPFGRIECSARMPTANRAWPVFWMLGSYDEYGEWPNCGEIDIFEYWGYQAPNVYTNLHTKHSNFINGKDLNRHSTSQVVSDASAEFHVYRMDWYSDRLEFYLDDSHYWTYNKIVSGWRK